MPVMGCHEVHGEGFIAATLAIIGLRERTPRRIDRKQFVAAESRPAGETSMEFGGRRRP